MFKKIATKNITLFVVFSLLIIVIPFNNILADSNPTYTVIDQAGCYELATLTYNNNNQIYTVKFSDIQTEVRFVVFKQSGAYTDKFVAVSDSSFKYIDTYSSSGCPLNNNTSSAGTFQYNGITYYVYQGYRGGNNGYSAFTWNNDINPVWLTGVGIGDQLYRNAIDYTYGNNAVAPEPLISYGDLKVGYSTEFVSSGDSTDRFNKDIITWDNYDSNGNLLDDINYTIELRAIPGYYTDVSQSQLLNQTIYNWIQGYVVKITNGAIDLQPFEYYTLGRWSPNKKQVEFTWGEVVDHFDMIDGHVGFVLNNTWYKAGWRYEIRYIKGDISDPEYTSEWQIIYQVTAVQPSTSDNILNSYGNGLSPELYNLLQTVNTLNNTVQNWNINGVPINMNQNQQVTPDNSWIEKLIESITSLLGSLIDGLSAIVQAIIGLGGDIIEGLFSIVSDSISTIINFFTDLWDDFTDLFNGFNFTDENSDYDINITDVNDDLPEGETLYDIIPSFVRMINNSGLGFFIWMPLIVGIIYIVL